MHIGFIEPHLKQVGGIRRVVEFGNRFVKRGHQVTYYLPKEVGQSCNWMECLGKIKPIKDSYADEIDVLIFNHEPQWFLMDRFNNVRLKVYYLLSYAVLYGKSDSWVSYRYPVDLYLANTTWTADNIENEIGIRPIVIYGGINPNHFRPIEILKEYDVLCYGSRRPWKGTVDIEKACRILNLRLNKYEGKGIPQEEMCYEYSKAKVFAVGSWVEGFGFPGLEALACGVPLVTTDCGGCRDYAIHEETALLVPPRDPPSMAQAIDRLMKDEALQKKLIRNGLEIVKSGKFDWDRNADIMLNLLKEKLKGESIVSKSTITKPKKITMPPKEEDTQKRVEEMTSIINLPEKRDEKLRLEAKVKQECQKLVSIITLSWDQLHYTQACINSIKKHTKVPYEIIIVDNGSEPHVVEYIKSVADKYVLNKENKGFAKGLNQGLGIAVGEYVVFLNNDTEVTEGWLSKLIETFNCVEDVGIVTPAVTTAGGFIHIRSSPNDTIREIFLFSAPPSAICYLCKTEFMRNIGGWCEEYEIASGEDADLCFTVWSQGYKIILDERILIKHIGKGTASVKIPDWKTLWTKNNRRFLNHWVNKGTPLTSPIISAINSISGEKYTRFLAQARQAIEELKSEIGRDSTDEQMEKERLTKTLANYLKTIEELKTKGRTEREKLMKVVVQTRRERLIYEEQTGKKGFCQTAISNNQGIGNNCIPLKPTVITEDSKTEDHEQNGQTKSQQVAKIIVTYLKMIEDLKAQQRDERTKLMQIIVQDRLAQTGYKEDIDNAIKNTMTLKFLYRKYAESYLGGTRIEAVLKYIWRKTGSADTSLIRMGDIKNISLAKFFYCKYFKKYLWKTKTESFLKRIWGKTGKRN